jgi:hypothetical protein
MTTMTTNFHDAVKISTATTTRSPSACRPARSRDAARPAPAGCRHRVRLADDQRPVARREPERRSSVQMRSSVAGSSRTPTERVLLAKSSERSELSNELASHRHAGRTTLTHRATRAARPADRRRRDAGPPAAFLGSFQRRSQNRALRSGENYRVVRTVGIGSSR